MPRLINADNGSVLLDHLEIADSFWKRLLGLQFRHSLSDGYGLLLSPCSTLHTCFMRFSIDVIMLDRENVVLGMKSKIRPWRAVICDRGTARVIEVRPGSIKIAVGTGLAWTNE